MNTDEDNPVKQNSKSEQRINPPHNETRKTAKNWDNPEFYDTKDKLSLCTSYHCTSYVTAILENRIDPNSSKLISHSN